MVMEIERGAAATFHQIDQERGLSWHELSSVWDMDIAERRNRLLSLRTLDDLVDNIRLANMRANVAHHKDMPEWRNRWLFFKHQCLLLALHNRAKNIRGIQVGTVDNIGVDFENFSQVLVFKFDVRGEEPYITRTASTNLTKIVSGDRLMGLIGQFDQI